jgi:hypothetical protein
VSGGVLFTDKVGNEITEFIDSHVPAFRGSTIDRHHDGSITLHGIDGSVVHIATGAWLAAIQA